ncbi:MAG: hypothetical protein ABSE59_06700 [Opitutaceae bacterium]|jgi:hypothetical protein
MNDKPVGSLSLHSKSSSLVSTADFAQIKSPAVSQDSSRKTFLLKLLGLAAGAGWAGRFLTRSAKQAVIKASPSAPVALRAEPRAIARRSDSV